MTEESTFVPKLNKYVFMYISRCLFAYAYIFLNIGGCWFFCHLLFSKSHAQHHLALFILEVNQRIHVGIYKVQISILLFEQIWCSKHLVCHKYRWLISYYGSSLFLCLFFSFSYYFDNTYLQTSPFLSLSFSLSLSLYIYIYIFINMKKKIGM